MYVTECPWGSDSDGDETIKEIKTAPRGLTRPTSKGKQITRLTNSAAMLPPPPTLPCCSPPTLQAYTLGCLALHLEDLIQYGDAVLPLLPSESKAALIAAARSRNELTDAALFLLADEGHSILDVHGCYPQISMRVILRAASLMPNLRYLDIRSLPLTPRFLITLAEACPRIEVLRLGGWTTAETAGTTEAMESLGDALIRILPRLDKERGATADSWDSVTEHDTSAGGGRFMGLKCIVWPEMPQNVKWHCERAAPAVSINPISSEVVSRGLPRACDPTVEIDEVALGAVAGAAMWGEGLETQEESQSEPVAAVVHIAERFRLAYESREKRLQAAEARRRRKEQRQVLSGSAAERLIHNWELEL